MPVIRDPVIYQWLYFPRPTGSGQEEASIRFLSTLRVLSAWSGIEGAGPTLPDVPDSPPQLSEMIVPGFWRQRDGEWRELMARTMLDTYVVRLGCQQRGLAGHESFRPLGKSLPVPCTDVKSPALVGRAFCLLAEVEGDPSEAGWAGMATECYRAFREGLGYTPAGGATGLALGESMLEGLTLTQGFFTVVSRAEQETVVLLYTTAGHAWAGSFLFSILPRFFLSRVKARALDLEYRGILRQRLRQEQAQLEQALTQAIGPHLPLREIERLSLEIARVQAHYIVSLSQLENRLQTIRVCIENIDRLANDRVWEGRSGSEQILRDDLVLLGAQVASDAQYYRNTQEAADRLLRGLETAAGVRSAQWERNITSVLLALSALAVAQVIPESHGCWRLFAALCSIPIFTITYLVFRRF